MIKNQVLSALHYVLAPLIRVLLRNGVTWSDFTEVAKEVFVQVAREDYGVQGRPTNTSRVALITGLSRREVTRVKDVLLGERPREAAAPSRISQILTAWHVDPQYVGPDGRPATLPAVGDGPSLATLLKQYAGDTPHGAVIKELEELGPPGRHRTARPRHHDCLQRGCEACRCGPLRTHGDKPGAATAAPARLRGLP
jgi:hypothetical protein